MRSSNRRVSTLAVVLAVGFGGAVSGCGLVVGSGDYVVGTVDGGGLTGGSDASQTIPPAGDGAAPGSDATAPPDAAGSPPPTEAGTTADGGPTSVCANGALVPGGLPTGDPAFQQLVNACVLAVSCDPLFFDVPVSDCINRDYLDTFFPDKCLAGIKSGASGPCDDYYACEGSRIAAPSECSEASTADTDIGTCNAGIATSCLGSGDGIIFNCGALGGTCTTYHESDYADFGDTAAGCQISATARTRRTTRCTAGRRRSSTFARQRTPPPRSGLAGRAPRARPARRATETPIATSPHRHAPLREPAAPTGSSRLASISPRAISSTRPPAPRLASSAAAPRPRAWRRGVRAASRRATARASRRASAARPSRSTARRSDSTSATPTRSTT